MKKIYLPIEGKKSLFVTGLHEELYIDDNANEHEVKLKIERHDRIKDFVGRLCIFLMVVLFAILICFGVTDSIQTTAKTLDSQRTEDFCSSYGWQYGFGTYAPVIPDRVCMSRYPELVCADLIKSVDIGRLPAVCSQYLSK